MFKKLLTSLTGMNNTKMVIIVRTDIGMGKGKIASQTAHAAVSLYESAVKIGNPHLNSWLRWGQPKLVLKVDSNGLSILTETYNKAIANNLNACMIHDAGRTQIEKGTLTVVGIGPNLTEDVDKITGNFKLL